MTVLDELGSETRLRALFETILINGVPEWEDA